MSESKPLVAGPQCVKVLHALSAGDRFYGDELTTATSLWNCMRFVTVASTLKLLDMIQQDWSLLFYRKTG